MSIVGAHPVECGEAKNSGQRGASRRIGEDGAVVSVGGGQESPNRVGVDPGEAFDET